MSWSKNLTVLNDCLSALETTDFSSNLLDNNLAFTKLEEASCKIKNERKTIFFVGNGASSSMASHVSADLAKNAAIVTQVFTDLSLITAIANDVAYEQVFSIPIKNRMREGDMLVAISSSGKSPNILRAVEQAHINRGFVVTLSAMEPTNPLRPNGHINFYIPAKTYGIAETGHNAILHHWIDIMTGDAL